MLVAAMKERRGQHLGDGSTFQGQRHRALLTGYGLLTKPGAQDLQALAGPVVHWTNWWPAEMVCLMTKAGFGIQDERREGVQHRLQHAGRHARGQGPGTLSSGMKIVNPIMAWFLERRVRQLEE